MTRVTHECGDRKRGRHNCCLTSRLTICLSRSDSWFLRDWISAVAGFNLGSRARITYRWWWWWCCWGGGLMADKMLSKYNAKPSQLLTSRAFSRYILYLSSIALMSSSFFFRAAISSSSFRALRVKKEVTAGYITNQAWVTQPHRRCLTSLGVIGLKVLQQLLLLHDFIRILIQLDPVGHKSHLTAPSAGELVSH